MEALFLKIVNISITASYLVLALIVLRPFLKKMPHWLRAGLWALPAFRLMLPRSLESVLSLIPSTQTLPEDFVYAARPWIHSGIRSVDAVINPVLSESMAPSPGASINPSQVFSFVFSPIRSASRIWNMSLPTSGPISAGKITGGSRWGLVYCPFTGLIPLCG